MKPKQTNKQKNKQSPPEMGVLDITLNHRMMRLQPEDLRNVEYPSLLLLLGSFWTGVQVLMILSKSQII